MGGTYTDDDIQRLGLIIAEDIKSEFRAGFEALEEIKRQTDKIPGVEADIEGVKSDMKAVKEVLKLTNKDIQGHEKRITKLDATVYG